MAVETKTCGNCTKCCEGYLKDNYSLYNGNELVSNKACKFSNKNVGCQIYKIRPTVCKEYNCFYITNTDIPKQFKPDIIENLITERFDTVTNCKYICILPAGKQINSELLIWLKEYFTLGKIDNIVYKENNEIVVLSTNKEFTKRINTIKHYLLNSL